MAEDLRMHRKFVHGTKTHKCDRCERMFVMKARSLLHKDHLYLTPTAAAGEARRVRERHAANQCCRSE